MSVVWGSAWLDARDGWESSVTQAVDRWVSVIDNGGHVWVAEGGVSDFTADVVRGVQVQRPDVDTIDVIHAVSYTHLTLPTTPYV